MVSSGLLYEILPVMCSLHVVLVRVHAGSFHPSTFSPEWQAAPLAPVKLRCALAVTHCALIGWLFLTGGKDTTERDWPLSSGDQPPFSHSVPQDARPQCSDRTELLLPSAAVSAVSQTVETGDVPSCFPPLSGMHPGLRPCVTLSRVCPPPPAC